VTRDDLVQRICVVLAADDRTLAAWLTGSLGRGMATDGATPTCSRR